MLNNKIIKYSLFFLGISILAIGVWYGPSLFKEYSVYSISPNALLARNIALTDSFSLENDLNVLLSTDLIKKQGQVSNYGNKLTSFIYAKIFKITGFLDENSFLLLSIIIHVLTLLIFTLVVLFLFNFKTASVFSLIYIFIPFNWILPYHFGSYEFALLFSSLFFLFYFLGTKEKQKPLLLIFSGLFLALAGLSKETFLLIIPFLIAYLLIKKQKAILLYILISFSLIFVSFWLPNINQNINIKLLSGNIPEKTVSSDFGSYGHLFPDPYTFHFKFDEYINNLKDQIDNNEIDLVSEVYIKKNMSNLAFDSIGVTDRFIVGTMILSKHTFKFISLEEVGGALVFLLILLGGYSLRNKNKDLYQFFLYWIVSAVFIFSYVVLVSRSHLMDFGWVLILLASLGIIHLSEKFNKKNIVLFIILLFALYNFVLVGHVVWNMNYDQSNILLMKAYGQKIDMLNISNMDVIAVNLSSSEINTLNYISNKSIIVFTKETVENLINNNELNNVFNKFKIKYILGYSDEINKKIIEQIDVINIASESIEPIEIDISGNKSWLMNLIK